MSEERRLVTVLFADVVGSTSLGESIDPEDLRALMRRYYSICREVVDSHGGTLEKFIGDAVMAVFGLPRAHGDDAARAVAAALELRQRVREDPGLGERLPIRLGVSTGEVVATAEATDGGSADGADFLITGDAVNVAARLQQSAAPWAVVATDRTARAATGFRYGPEQLLEARGRTAPVSCFEVLGSGSQRRATVPLIGRDDDLLQLELVARRAINERRPFLATLIAPPGTGKTRLLEEFMQRLPDVAPQSQVTVAQCLPYGQRLTYWPLRAVLHQLVGLAEDAPPELIREATVRWLAEAGVADAQRVAGYLATTVGAGEADVADAAALFAAWRTFIEAAAERRPLVLVFEDLHWSSDGLLDLVDHVMQPRADVPVLMLVLTRPELLDRRPAWGAGRRNQVSIALEPLDDESVGELVRHLLESASNELVDAVVARAEGNPFYAGELVRGIVDRVGPKGLEDDPARLLERLPDTVQATVLARLDLLVPQGRRMLQLGSVLGRSFSTPGLVALGAGPATTVERHVETLLERDMIRPQGADRYVFRHILIREVAYGTLPRAERARLHAAAGAWLEERAAGQEEAYAELIAYHYREAALLATVLGADEAQPSRQRAYRWLIRASEASHAAAASIETDRHLRNALEFAGPADLPDLHERLGDARLSGDGTVRDYELAYRLSVEAGRSPDDLFRILAKLLEYEMRFEASVGKRRSRLEMDGLVAEGHALAARSQDKRARATFLAGLAFLPFWAQRVAASDQQTLIDEGEQAGREALRLAEGLDDAQLISSALDGLGAIFVQRGDQLAMRETSRRRLAMGERLNLFERTDAYGVAAWASAVIGDLADAEAAAAAGLALIQPGQVPEMAIHSQAWRAYALLLLGRWDEVTPLVERARAAWVETGRSSMGYAVRGFLAAFDVARARRDPAGMQRWKEVVSEIVAQFAPDEPLRSLSTEHVALDGPALAREVEMGGWQVARLERYERALSLLSDLRQPVSQGLLRTYLEVCMRHQAKPVEGQIRRMLALTDADVAEARRALEVFEACGAAPLAARARCEVALLAGDSQLLQQGIAELERLGDEDQVGRYERWALDLGLAAGGTNAC